MIYLLIPTKDPSETPMAMAIKVEPSIKPFAGSSSSDSRYSGRYENFAGLKTAACVPIKKTQSIKLEGLVASPKRSTDVTNTISSSATFTDLKIVTFLYLSARSPAIEEKSRVGSINIAVAMDVQKLERIESLSNNWKVMKAVIELRRILSFSALNICVIKSGRNFLVFNKSNVLIIA